MTNQTIPHPRPTLLAMPALADDTPSRHPCKIRIPSAQKRYMFDPYKAQVTLGLESDESGDSEGEGVDDCAFDHFTQGTMKNATVVAANEVSKHHQQQNAPQPVDLPSPITAPTVSSTSDANVLVSPLQELRRALTTKPTPATSSSAHHTNKSGLSSLPPPSDHQNHFPAPSLLLDEPSTAPGATTGMLAQPILRDDSPPLDEDEAQGLGERHSSAHQQVGGAHYTNQDGCFRINAGSMHHALVRFKFSEDVYVVPLCDRRGLCVGDLVVVEGDRGENIGQVAADMSEHHDAADMSQKQIIRRALNKDRKKYYHARRKDALASKAAQQIVQDFGLKMHVLDAEFQSDLMKLTIYFRGLGPAGEPIDFREIQRGLFKQFRCRIWLLNWDDDKNLQRLVSKQLLSQQPHVRQSTPAPSEEGGFSVLGDVADRPPITQSIAAIPVAPTVLLKSTAVDTDAVSRPFHHYPHPRLSQEQPLRHAQLHKSTFPQYHMPHQLGAVQLQAAFFAPRR